MNHSENNKYTSKNVTRSNAKYLKPSLKEYQGNPLIEALPAIKSKTEVADFWKWVPPVDKEDFESKWEDRLHCVCRLDFFFQPYGVHFDLEQRISRAIRQGYLSRNPMNRVEVQRTIKSYQGIQEGKFIEEYEVGHRHTVSGFTIIGLSGVGKTTAIEKVLNLYPQVINHQEYNGELFTFTQVPWLLLDCPFDGTPKGLCISFFAKLDELLGTDYLRKFGGQRNSTDLMLQRVAHLSIYHGIGMMVVDEIQHLNENKSGGHRKLLNFFVTFVNTVGLPVVLVGTNKAARILQKEFRQARRGSGQGDLVWENMPQNKSWEYIIEKMWPCQYTLKPVPWSQNFSDLLYLRSQGIMDIAVKLFMLAQWHAIAIGSEQVTEKVINMVADERLRLVQPMLDALRTGNKSDLYQYEDMQPIDMSQAMADYIQIGEARDRVKARQAEQEMRNEHRKMALEEQVYTDLMPLGFEEKDVKRMLVSVLKEFGGKAARETISRQVAVRLNEQETLKTVKVKKEKGQLKELKKTVHRLAKLKVEAHKNKKTVYEWLESSSKLIKHPLKEEWRGGA